ncbi:MAG TPA: class I SAM-dependent methyltransferase [Pyrinomonadaceae bacterium]|nr:class I SAM-dependent methyltransferase [Pyrinomonadaceae bacterium]
MRKDEKYIPALNFDRLTPLYDTVVRWLMPESEFKGRLVEQARVRAGHRVLDIGCGTATLTILAKQAHPGAEVFGLDGDPKILEIARRKAARAGAEITLREGLSFRLPFADESFDRALSSLMLHHLTPANKQLTLAEARRVLRPGGELHVADFRKHNESLPEMMGRAGFEQARECGGYRTLLGRLALWQARRP